MINRRQQLLEWYGIGFPDDLFAVWDLACELQPDEPRAAFGDIGLGLYGVFDVLAGDFDEKPPDGRLWTHEMAYNDPPEFFSIFWGRSDGYHLGLWFDDPMEPPTAVAGYWSLEGFDLGFYPANLFLTLRAHLELSYMWTQETLESDPENTAAYEEELRRHDELRELLTSRMPVAARGREQTGCEYVDQYDDRDVERAAVNRPRGLEGIAAPPHLYRTPQADEETIQREVRGADGAARWLRAAEQALHDGYPATALKLGKDLWHLAPMGAKDGACQVMVAAYNALGRPLLGEVLKARKEQRDQWDAMRKAKNA
jgi:hypothetical protein